MQQDEWHRALVREHGWSKCSLLIDLGFSIPLSSKGIWAPQRNGWSIFGYEQNKIQSSLHLYSCCIPGKYSAKFTLHSHGISFQAQTLISRFSLTSAACGTKDKFLLRATVLCLALASVPWMPEAPVAHSTLTVPIQNASFNFQNSP